jgi:broad specificity phosphatase PhoE
MSEILLVRHGQASARSRNYDVLSPLGIQQARRLGSELGRRGARFDAVFSGPRVRQRDTAHHLVAAARSAGAALPDVIELPGCDEIPLGDILVVWLPRVVDVDPVARAIAEHRYVHTDEQIRHVLTRAMQAWAAGEVATPSLPNFASFVARIEEALAHVRDHGEATLLVTSAGPVAATLHLAQHEGAATADEVIRLAMDIFNASVTRVVHDGRRLRVASLQDLSHLPDAERTLL